jgi:hypothetical protein
MIADEFDIDIVSEHELQFWGYETQEEWYAAWDAMGEKYQHEFYNEVVKFVRGENHDIKSGTVGMIEAARMWTVRRFACGKSTAVKSTIVRRRKCAVRSRMRRPPAWRDNVFVERLRILARVR